MGLFDKKYCDICGEKIGLLGNRKLEDGNLCKNCAKGLSPWFSERRHSTVNDIKEQLAYREENRTKAAQFRTTRAFGENCKVLLDEEHRWFTVTRARDLAEANPDILDYSALTGCRMDIDEERTEIMRKTADGKEESYVPPRYEYSYDFEIIITVQNPYFDEMRFRLNSSTVSYEPTQGMHAMPGRSSFGSQNTFGGRSSFGSQNTFGGRTSFGSQNASGPENCMEYRQYRDMGNELCEALREVQQQARSGGTAPAAPQPQNAPAAEAPAAAAAPSGSWVCPACGGSNSSRFCEYCGTPRPQ